jgi:polygalacturonase
LRGLTIDYDPLPFTEARITAVAPDKRWVAFEIIEGYPDHQLVERVEIYNPATGELRRPDAGWEKTFEPLGNHRYRIAKRPGYRFDAARDLEQVGDILVTNHSFPDNAGGHAITLDRCTNITLDAVTLYASPSFGFVEHQCERTTYRRCKIDRRAPADDWVKRGFPRMRSLNADAFHSVEATKGPAIIQCTAKFQGDDCVNIHGTYHFVTACDSNRLRVAVQRRMTLEAGDPVEFLPFNGPRPPDAVAQQIERDPLPMTDAERAVFQKVNLHQNMKELMLGGKAMFYTVTLDRSLTLPLGSQISAANRIGNELLVQGCDFGFNRSRGILIKASRGEILNNRITHGWMAGILVSPEYWWNESGTSSDLEIRGNTILGCRQTAIEVVAPGGDRKPLPASAHRNITILNNRIGDCPWPVIHVTSTDGLTIRGNRVESTTAYPPCRPGAKRFEITESDRVTINE